MSLVLGIDLETTGLSAAKNCITEIGAALYDTETKTPLMILSEIIKVDEKIPARIVTLTGITDAMVAEYGKPIPEVVAKLNEMTAKADYVVAHNAPFDLGFLKALNEAIPVDCLKLPVLDTMRDLPLDAMTHPSVKLQFLAASHQFLNPFAHRAIFDVLTMLKILSNYDVDLVHKRANSPELAIISKAPFAQKDEVKAAGFKWNPKAKIWFKQVKECDYKDEDHQYQFDFEVVPIT